MQRTLAPELPLQVISDSIGHCPSNSRAATELANLSRVPRHRFTQLWMLSHYLPLQDGILLPMCNALEKLHMRELG